MHDKTMSSSITYAARKETDTGRNITNHKLVMQKGQYSGQSYGNSKKHQDQRMYIEERPTMPGKAGEE